jgi:hypothetical protein
VLIADTSKRAPVDGGRDGTRVGSRHVEVERVSKLVDDAGRDTIVDVGLVEEEEGHPLDEGEREEEGGRGSHGGSPSILLK